MRQHGRIVIALMEFAPYLTLRTRLLSEEEAMLQAQEAQLMLITQ